MDFFFFLPYLMQVNNNFFSAGNANREITVIIETFACYISFKNWHFVELNDYEATEMDCRFLPPYFWKLIDPNYSVLKFQVFNFSTGRVINKTVFDDEITAMDHDHTGQLIFCGDAQVCSCINVFIFII